MSETPIRKGDAVFARDARGEWFATTALSDIEPVWRWSPVHRIRHKIHDFPVIWVSGKSGTDRIPWPAEDVRRTETP